MKQKLLVISKIAGIFLICTLVLGLQKKYSEPVLLVLLSGVLFHVSLAFLFISDKIQLSERQLELLAYLKERLKITNHGISIDSDSVIFSLSQIDKEVKDLNLEVWYQSKKENTRISSVVIVKKINWWLFCAIFFPSLVSFGDAFLRKGELLFPYIILLFFIGLFSTRYLNVEFKFEKIEDAEKIIEKLDKYFRQDLKKRDEEIF